MRTESLSSPIVPARARLRNQWAAYRTIRRPFFHFLPLQESLQMRFEEPEVLVELAREGGKEISGNFVAQIVALIDGLTQRIGMMGHVVNEPFELRGAVRGGEIGFFQTALRSRFASGAVGHAAESDNAFSDGVGLILEMCRYGIKELMKLDEMHALDVPVGPFHLAAEIHAIREPGIQKRHDGLPVGLYFFANA